MFKDYDITSKEELITLHRKQKKELQAKIQSLKKSIPKGDRARLKEAQKNIASLENDLKSKQANELEEFEKQESGSSKNIASQLDDMALEDTTTKNSEVKVSKAQKKRERKAAKAKELSARLAHAEADYENTARYQEAKQIKEKLMKLGLVIKQILSDGNCMYSAIHDQLNAPAHSGLNTDDLRKKTSGYIRENKNDFLPFMTSKHTGDMLTPNEFESYCEEILLPSTWGGQIELLALSHVLHLPIHVIQADVDTTIHGEQSDSEPVILTYHKHELGLGEHYNSVTKSVNPDESIPIS